MVQLCLLLIPVAMAISLPLTAVMVRLGHRLRAYDSVGVAGQVKAPRRLVPNTGGVAIFWAIVLPLLAALLLVRLVDPADVARLRLGAEAYLAGVRQQTPMALSVIAALALLHILGTFDDRRPLGPWIKLAVMAIAALAIPIAFPDTRLLSMLDARVGGGWASTIITAFWFLIVTNAFNFMDNMDGLSSGVATIASAFFLAAALVNGQWFVAACLAILIGACLGFLSFNFPARGSARIFMGDKGSLVIGFFLAFLTVRTTYYASVGTPDHPLVAGSWYGLLMPIVVLAVPLYDFTTVVAIRCSQGRSPFVGDLQHLSHRLVNLGLTRRAAVGVIYGLTAITGVTGVVLGTLKPWQAILAGAQVLMVLLVIAMFEYARAANRELARDAGTKEPS